MRRVSRAFVAIAALATLLGCGSRRSESSPAAVDGGALRIVSLSPSTTEALFAVGAGKELVGRSRYCNYPPEVSALPQVGGYVDPNVEAILDLRPSLVVGARGPAGSKVSETLAARGIGTFFPPAESFAEVDALLLALGERTGHAGEARATVDRLHADLVAVENEARRGRRARVLIVFGLTPIVVAGPKGFPDEMLGKANAENVVREGDGYPTVSIERVIAWDPEVVVNAAFGEPNAREALRSDAPGWKSVPAVRAGRVAVVTDESVLRPGPRLAEGVRVLSRAIQGASPSR